MERSSRVLHHGNPKMWIFFQKSLKFEFWLLTKSWNHLSFVNISPTLVIDTSMERSSRVLRHGNPKIGFFFQKSSKFEFWLLTKSWNHISFVNISPTLVIDASMEWSSRVLRHGNPKIDFFFKKVRNSNFDKKLKSPLIRQYQSYISNWYINGKVFTSTTAWKPRNVKNFQKVQNWRNWILSVPWVSVCQEKNRPVFVNISPTLVIDTSTERSSRVLQHGNQKIWFFFKKFEIEFDLYFDLCWRTEIIQLGLNMHLNVDIGDASSSLWGSTSSYVGSLYFFLINDNQENTWL